MREHTLSYLLVVEIRKSDSSSLSYIVSLIHTTTHTMSLVLMAVIENSLSFLCSWARSEGGSL